MKNILTTTLFALLLSFGAKAQPANQSTDCLNDYEQAFKKRGTFPMQDGIQKVAVAVQNSEGKSQCYVGQILVKDNSIVPPLYIARSNGSFTQAIGNFDEDFYKQAEGKAPKTITDGQTAMYMLKDGRKARLFFTDFLKPDAGDMVKAPDVGAQKKDAAVNPADIDKINVSAKSIRFETGKAVIAKNSYAALDAIVQIMKTYQNTKWTVQGFTDNVGNQNSNLVLSNDRAMAVQSYLVSHGIGAANLYAAGFGADNPIADNTTAEGKAQNRRVEIKMIQ